MPAPNPEKMLRKVFGDDLEIALQRNCVAQETPAIRKAAVNFIYAHNLVQVARLKFAFNADPSSFRLREYDFRSARAILRMRPAHDEQFDKPGFPDAVEFEGHYNARRHYGKPLTAGMLIDWTRYAQDTFLQFSERISLRDYQISYQNRESLHGRVAHLITGPGRADELVHQVRAYAPANADFKALVEEFTRTTDAVSVNAEMVVLGPDGNDVVTSQCGDIAALLGNR